MSGRFGAFVGGLIVAVVLLWTQNVVAESRQEYQNRVRLMVDSVVQLNEYVRQHLSDRGLASYCQAVAERTAKEAERMTPPPKFSQLHPHMVMVVENIERALFFASSGELGKYRRYQRIIRKEMQILETLAHREQLELQMYGGGY